MTGKFRIDSGIITVGKQALARAIKTLQNGEYGFEFRSWNGFKTTLQIRAFHGPVLNAYCAHTGMTKQDAKRHLKIEYGQCHYFTRNGVNYVELKSLADYSKSESFIPIALTSVQHAFAPL